MLPVHGLALWLSLLSSAVVIALWSYPIIVGALRWREVRPLLRAGLLLAIVLLLLDVPAVAWIATLDFSRVPALRLLEAHHLAAPLAVAAMVGWALVGFAHAVFTVPAIVLLHPERHAFPWLPRARGSVDGWWAGAAVGLSGGIASALAMRSVGIKAGELMERVLASLQQAPPAVAIACVVALPLSAALTEELAFRGTLQPWLTRRLGGSGAAAAAAIAVTSLAWALAHAANTEPMWPKLVQVFLLGLAFGAIARRWSVEASMVAHVTLNLAVVATTIVDRPGP